MNRIDEERFAQEIRSAYIAARENYEYLRTQRKIKYKPPARYDGSEDVVTEDGVVLEQGKQPIWKKLARLFIKHNITDPYIYINTIFEEYYNSPYPPRPEILTKEEYLSLWDKIIKNEEERIALEFRLQMELLKKELIKLCKIQGWSEVQALESVLTDNSIPFHILFRYCIAYRYKNLSTHLQNLVDAIKDKAIDAFQKYKNIYRKHWSIILPEHLSERGNKYE